jgi:anti-anti-sigma factor
MSQQARRIAGTTRVSTGATVNLVAPGPQTTGDDCHSRRRAHRSRPLPLLQAAQGQTMGMRETMMALLNLVRHAGGTTCLISVGRIDSACADEFRRVLFDAADVQPRRTIVGVRVLMFADSSGIAALFAARCRFHRYGLAVRLADPRRQLRQTLTVGGVFDVLTRTALAPSDDRSRPAQ